MRAVIGVHEAADWGPKETVGHRNSVLLDGAITARCVHVFWITDVCILMRV
jgi:hypothetical protein